MSTRAPKRGRSWLSEIAGQMAAIAAVPVAIVLALALKPPPSDALDKRTDPLWHDASHARICPACRLLSHQGESPAEAPPPSIGVSLPEPAALPIDAAIGSAALLRDAEVIPIDTPPTSVL
jgi:hypothetical protein